MIGAAAATGDEVGFTLIEMMVALALFALIGVAGLTLVNSILDIQARTAGRLDRLAALQRAVFILDADLTQLAPGPIVQDARGIAFSRHAGVAGNPDQSVGYRFSAAGLERRIGGRRQRLLSGISGARLSFFQPGAGWRDRWPPSPEQADTLPAAIAVDVVLAPGGGGVGGTLRRVVELPARP